MASGQHHAWRGFLALGLMVCGVFAVAGEPLRGWLLVALVVAAGVCVTDAWRRWGWRWSPVALFALATWLLVPAYALWYPLTLAWDLDLVAPSAADALFLTALSCYVAALAWLLRRRTRRERGGWLLDASIITAGISVLAWVFVVSPYAHDDSLSLVARANAIAYPVMDLAILVLTLGLLLQRSRAAPAERLFLGWAGSLAVADMLYAASVLDGSFSLSSGAVIAYPLSFVLLGAGALHPATAREPAPPTVRLHASGPRLIAVALAALIAPMALVGLALRGETESIPGVALICGVLFVLVLLRVATLMVDVATYERTQGELRRAINEERRRMDENRLLVQSLRERQALSERLFRIQRKISSRAPLQEVLDAITHGAAELLGDEVVGLRLVRDDDPTVMDLVSSVGIPAEASPLLRELRVGEGLGGLAVQRNRLCIREGYSDWSRALAPFASSGLVAAMSTPVHLDGKPIGSLTVATHRPSRRYSVAEQDVLSAFAEHVSLALNDARTVEAMNRALDQAVHQAMHDGLTGLPNRACVYDRIDQALREARRRGTGTAVLLFDLDRFKEINDTLGHGYGDEVLRQIGPRIMPLLRDGDTFARLGGDEFCVLLPDVDGVEAAAEVAARIAAALDEPLEVEGLHLTVEASCGVTVAPDHGDSVELLLQRADLAMYAAKGSGEAVEVYRSELDQNSPERLAVLSELRAGIAAGELVLHLQPQAALPGGSVVGVEVLVRWDHPRLGLLSPGRFVPLAEDTGLIKPLTSWVLDASLGLLRRWTDSGTLPVGEPFTMAVNLSTRSLLDEGFLDEVSDLLELHGVPGEQLLLEVTETTLLADPARAQRVLTGLARLGVRFAVDDFGTGYSSMGMLKALPVTQLKVDRSFVAAMHEDANDATIVRSVIDLGHTLGLEVVAEGVERQETWQQLADLGCDAAQGYLLARPMPPAECESWLVARARGQGVAVPVAGA